MCVCVSVISLTAKPLMYVYKERYEWKENEVLKVFDSWILLNIFYSKDAALFAHHNKLTVSTVSRYKIFND